MTDRGPPPIQVARAPDGPLTYLVETAPEALPPVRSADLDDAWSAARDAAADARWGHKRLFRFLRADGTNLDLALTDDDACCWAAAVDQTAGIHTPYGLSLCLRLLALVDLLGRAPWLEGFFRLKRSGAALAPALIRTAAAATLNSQAGFDEVHFHALLSQTAPHRPDSLITSGASS